MPDKKFVNQNNEQEPFIITFDDDGIYLAVFPLQKLETQVNYGQVVDELKKRNVQNFDVTVINKVIKECSGEKVKIANIQIAAEPPDINIIVSRDRMEAILEIHHHKGGRKLTLPEALNKINEYGIIFGIDVKSIEKALTLTTSNSVCARGQKPINGSDAYLNYYFDFDTIGRPANSENGKVNFKDINKFICVTENQLLAEKIPATAGIDGIDVFGNPIPAKPGKDLPLLIGKNTRYENETIIATASGHLEFINKRLTVVPVINIDGDVDLSVGNIDFVGNIIIKGSVKPGFCVKSNGNIEVHGSVNGGTLEAENIVVRMGIQGMNTGLINARKDVTAKFLENSTVFAGNNVTINSYILHSTVNAGKRIIISDRQGLVAGGKLSAGEEISLATVGTQLSPSTILEVGVNPLLRDEYRQLRRDIKSVEYDLAQTTKALDLLNSIDANSLSQEKKELLLRLTKTHFHILGKLEPMKKRLSTLEVDIEEMRSGKISVANFIYPGTTVIVGSIVKPIREILQYVQLTEQDGEIKITPFK